MCIFTYLYVEFPNKNSLYHDVRTRVSTSIPQIVYNFAKMWTAFMLVLSFWPPLTSPHMMGKYILVEASSNIRSFFRWTYSTCTSKVWLDRRCRMDDSHCKWDIVHSSYPPLNLEYKKMEHPHLNLMTILAHICRLRCEDVPAFTSMLFLFFQRQRRFSPLTVAIVDDRHFFADFLFLIQYLPQVQNV